MDTCVDYGEKTRPEIRTAMLGVTPAHSLHVQKATTRLPGEGKGPSQRVSEIADEPGADYNPPHG